MSRLLAYGIAIALGAAALSAQAQAAPVASPDPLTDVADTAEDPFPEYDEFAWRAFLALNWPADAQGAPDRAATLASPGRRVWEAFGARDAALSPERPSPCPAAPGEKTVASVTPFAEFNQTTFTPGEPGSPLVARNHTYVRYETRFNAPEFDWIAKAHGLGFAPVGAVAVKAAWRLLTKDDPPAVRARYYVAQGAWIADVAASRAAGHVVCARADLALVGLHIVARTPSQPQGIWATFEHVDNTPPAGLGDAREPDAADEGAPYAFNNPRDQQQNIFPPQGWRVAAPVSATNPPRLDPPPAQVVRRHPIRREIMAANHAFWALPDVARSVWRRYMLVSVQWPTVIAPRGPENDGRYFPGLTPEPGAKAAKYKVEEGEDGRNLANAVMETYLQDAPNSCMACHHAVGNLRGHDFVGVFAAAPPPN